MIGFLIKRILALALLVGAIVVMPFAGWIAAFLFVIIFALSLMKQGFSDVGPGAAFFLIIAGFFALSRGLGFLNDLSQNYEIMTFLIIAFCCVALFLGGRFFRKFVVLDRNNFNMESQVERLTRYYPQLMMISAALRIVIEAARTFFAEMLADFISYLDLGVTIGTVMFALSILMYILRTIHIFIENK